MSDKELEIFEFCERLAELLRDKEVIADLQTLLEKHPEMFQKQVANLVKKVINDPEIIINNPTPKSEKEHIAGRKLNDKKMADVVIKNESGTNEIEQSSLDSLNERFTQALEEHKQNQRERYGDSQGQDNNNDSTESKKSYKRR